MAAAVVAAAAALAAGTFPVCPKAAAARAAAAGAPHIPTPVMVWWLAVGASVTALPLALVVPQVNLQRQFRILDSRVLFWGPRGVRAQLQLTRLRAHSPPVTPHQFTTVTTHVCHHRSRQTLCWRTGLVSGSLWAIAVTGRIEAIGILGLCIASAAAAVVRAV